MTEEPAPQTIRHVHFFPALWSLMFIGFGAGVGELIIHNPIAGSVLAGAIALLRG